MKASFKGDTLKLDKWAKRLREVPNALDTLSEQLAEETIGLVREGFENSEDPYGAKWASLKLRDGRPLEDNGHLKSSWFRKYATRKGFAIANAKKYAIYHQRGTGIHGPSGKRIEPTNAKALRIPIKGSSPIFARSVKGTVARPMLPHKKRLPKRWTDRYREVAEDVLTELFRK